MRCSPASRSAAGGSTARPCPPTPCIGPTAPLIRSGAASTASSAVRLSSTALSAIAARSWAAESVVSAGSPPCMSCTITTCIAGGVDSSSTSGGRGAGIALVGGCNAKIANGTIQGNSAYVNSLGGGLYCYQSVAVVTGGTIAGNLASGNLRGGGVYAGGDGTDLTLKNCVISQNTADAGAGGRDPAVRRGGPLAGRARGTMPCRRRQLHHRPEPRGQSVCHSDAHRRCGVRRGGYHGW